MKEYDPKKIESKWQKFWEKNKTFQTPKDATRENKFYILPQLPYPSGSGLHVGHAEVYTACDIYARYQRMKGKKVLQVIGWDSFGLPAENYAIKTNIHPKKSTEDAIDNFRSQIKSLGISVDWEREVGSHNPDYYKWTQWFFLLMYKRGLAYRKKQSVNWCDGCKTVLANEQVVTKGNGEQGIGNRTINVCERCETEIIQREMEQWYLKITEYADRLLEGFDRIDWPEETKKRQKDWIGRSEGALITFSVIPSGARSGAKGGVEESFGEKNFLFSSKEEGSAGSTLKDPSTTPPAGGFARDDKKIEVFTTRPDTLFGATYLVLAPEHLAVRSLKSEVQNWNEVEKYIEETAKKTELDRQTEKEKTGVELKGIKAINPANGEEIPVWIADYVLVTYGTGAIMAVPAHDERDFEFAKKFGLEVREVVAEQLRPRLPDWQQKDVAHGICIRDGKLLLVYNKLSEEYQLPGGGIEYGEDAPQALSREIAEETGYTDIEIIRSLGQFEYSYWHKEKLLNRLSLAHGYAFELKSTKTIARPEKEEKNLAIEWVDLNELEQKMRGEIWGPIIQKIYQRTNFESMPPFVQDGVSVNSDFLNGLPTKDAKEKIIEWLEKNGHGKRKTQYKLRDWSVSRQRFWGAPIPMIFNEQRAKSKKQYVLVHGYTGSAEANFFPWLKKELENRGHAVWSETLPNPDQPSVEEQADYILAHAPIDTETVFVAHSLGGSVVLHLLEKMKGRVAKVLFVDSFYSPKFSDRPRPYVEQSFQWKFDFEKIRASADEFVMLADDRYATIPKEHGEAMRQILDARLVATHGVDEHYCSLEEPDVLEHALVDGFLSCNMDDLPVLLPNDVDFKPTGQSPLTYSEDFQKGVEKTYGKGWKREPDTLDTFMCSSWYFFRYLDAHNENEFASPEVLKQWMPIDFYLGGAEHVNGHLLYSRFFTKVLYDAGYIDFDEPFTVNRHQGLILGSDGRKMSKRWGNVINPSDVVDAYGADTMRMYEMFMGPLEDDKPWDENGVKGVRRFLERVWRLREKIVARSQEPVASPHIEKLLHQTLKKITEDLDTLSFNTAIAKMMELVNAFQKEESIEKKHIELFVLMLAPFAPHMAEELWAELGHKKSIAFEPWPAYDAKKIVEDAVTIAVQVNGKLRASMMVPVDLSESDITARALAEPNVHKWIDGKKPKKIIYIKNKILNIVL